MKTVIVIGPTGRWCLLACHPRTRAANVEKLKKYEKQGHTIDHLPPGLYEADFNGRGFDAPLTCFEHYSYNDLWLYHNIQWLPRA